MNYNKLSVNIAGGGKMSRHFKRNITFLALCLVLSLFAGKRVCLSAEYGAPLLSANGEYEYKLYKPQGSTQTCASIVSYLGEAVYVTLPTNLDGYKVTGVEPRAFSYDKVVQVNIPEGYLQIDYAFEGCKQLKTAYLPSTIKTCEGAFHESTLEYVSIGAGEYDLTGAFVNCKSLKKAIISGTVDTCTEAFKGCSALKDVTIKSASDYNNFYKTFQGCTSLEDVTIPEKVTFLNSTFYGCTSLNRVVLPKTLDSMENVFFNCAKLTEVHFEGNDCQWEQMINGDGCYFSEEDTLDEVIKKGNVFFRVYDKHVFSDWKVTKEPTTTEYGQQERTCKKCGLVQQGGLIPKLTAATSKTFRVKLKKSYMYYTGSKLKMPVKAVYANGTKISAEYFTVTYKKNKNVGVAKAVIKGKGKYKGWKGTATWKIKLQKPTLKTARSKKKGKLTVTWKKDLQAQGYVIQISQDKSFKSGVKTVNIVNGKTVKKTVSGLTNGKTYYVRIRSFKKVSGSLWHSSWSAKKEAKIK